VLTTRQQRKLQVLQKQTDHPIEVVETSGGSWASDEQQTAIFHLVYPGLWLTVGADGAILKTETEAQHG
jgi:hypothetical protein